jgi:DNA-binding transcriptional LysR family regulator
MEASMELSQLHYFRTIARSGSLSGAARQLGVSQPTLSIALRRLEEALGSSLFHRGRDGVRLTQTGQALLGHAEHILLSVEVATQAVRGLETEEVGRFVIGCPDTLGAFFLPGLLTRLFRQMPRLELSLWNGVSREVERAVLERQADFGLVSRMLPHPELVRVELFEDVTQLFALGPAARTLQQAKERMRQAPLLYVERLPTTPEMLRRLGEMGALPERRLPCGTAELVKNMALAGVGVAILPARAAAYGHPGALVPVHRSLPSVPDTVSLIYRADLHRTRACLRLKEELVAHGRALQSSVG